MALPVISASDFEGWIDIVANSFKSEKLDLYVDTFREQYLRKIVGDAVYADISAQTRQKWTDLIVGVDYVDVNGKRKHFGGLTEALKNFIYFEFVRDDFTSTQTGKTQGSAENSERSPDLSVLNIARSRFNRGVSLVNCGTPPFLEANKEFNELATSSNDEGDNTYTLDIPNTKYLRDGRICNNQRY